MYSEKEQMPENIPFSGTTTEQGIYKRRNYHYEHNAQTGASASSVGKKHMENLNGEWDFSFDFGKSGVDRCFYEKKDWEKKIIVPF